MPATVDEKRYPSRRILKVDGDAFTAEMARHGFLGDDAIAGFLETNRTTVARIRRGETLPSNSFLAACSDAGVNFLSFLRVENRGTPTARAA